MNTGSPVAMLGFGQVRHTRLRPVLHAFAYPSYFMMLPLRSLKREAAQAEGEGRKGWRINQPGLLSFFEADHGDGRPVAQGGALAWLDELLQREGIHDATGEAWLHCFPRVLGYTFKPVSFWYCHRAADDQGGALRAIVVEVNNTFGERHCYLLDAPRWGAELRADKVFHVSPFFKVEGHYRFRFMRSQDRCIARIDLCEGDGEGVGADEQPVLLQTSLSGRLEALNAQTLRRAFWRYPVMTLGVLVRIHLHAWQLWRKKKLPFFSKPAPPQAFVSRQLSPNPAEPS
ncbi:DUF1365 domain-containing protein [Roseateles sp. PN1]|uniref:DUF1365 domain-containing protein n=1 Tax=Roseateles sp. PN1 TaxID=3137372 RepID=UPI0031388584